MDDRAQSPPESPLEYVVQPPVAQPAPYAQVMQSNLYNPTEAQPQGQWDYHYSTQNTQELFHPDGNTSSGQSTMPVPSGCMSGTQPEYGPIHNPEPSAGARANRGAGRRYATGKSGPNKAGGETRYYDPDGTPWVLFPFTKDGKPTIVRICVDIEDLDVMRDVNVEFRTNIANLVYPCVLTGLDRNNKPVNPDRPQARWQADVNKVGLKLLCKNQTKLNSLRGGTLQRAVDSYHNTHPDERIWSRRVSRKTRNQRKAVEKATTRKRHTTQRSTSVAQQSLPALEDQASSVTFGEPHPSQQGKRICNYTSNPVACHLIV